MAGARIIEVPGTGGNAAADNLAAKLTELVGDVAEVRRPVKTVEIRLSGLDETATPETIRAEVAAKGSCQPEQVRVGKLRVTYSHTVSVIVTCPVEAANTLLAAGRILVGSFSARVEGLAPLAMRCYRCMELGHTRALCTSPVDRSSLCFRCGKADHTTSDCEVAKPRCLVCAHHGPTTLPPRMRGMELVVRTPVAPPRGGEVTASMEH